MSKFSAFAVVAAVSLALFATGADAARFIPRPSTPANGADPDICTTLCFTTNTGGTLTGVNPNCFVRGNGGVTLTPRLVVVRPPKDCGKGGGSDTAYQACGDQLTHLRRVTVGQVRRVGDEVVHLVPLCDTVHRTLTEEQTRYLARGNVQGLIPTIATNDTLMSELEDNGYEANDVIGIALQPDAAVLYVSRR